MKKITTAIMVMIMAITLISITTITSFAASAVPGGAKQYKGHTYFVFSANVSWEKAQELCEKRGGHLVIINNAKENDFVADLISDKGLKRCWLGATDAETEGEWKWVNGKALSYTAWDLGEPDNNTAGGEEGEDYLQTDYYSNEWNDAVNNPASGHDTDSTGYVCEWDMNKKKANSVRISAKKTTVNYAAKKTIKVLNTNKKAKWTTSNKKVATVNKKGQVTAVGLGTCKITAKLNGKKYVCKVTVKDRNVKAPVTMDVVGGGYFIKGASPVNISFKPEANCAKATVSIVNATGDTVYTKVFTKLSKNTAYTFNWNGINSSGSYVPSGSYKATVKINNAVSESVYLSFADTNEFAGGNGSSANPFVVQSIDHLRKVVKYPEGCFIQANDIDFNYTSIPSLFSADQPFNGIYDGAGKTIRNISGTSALFDTVGEKGVIKNVKTVNCSVVGNNAALLVKNNYGNVQSCDINAVVTVTLGVYGPKSEVGVIALNNYGTISNCSSSGQISSSTNRYYQAYAGGIANYNDKNGKIISCLSKVNVHAETNNGCTIHSDVYAGGIVSYNKGLINGCEASGTITASSRDDLERPGGIAGYNGGQIMSSYYTGTSTVNIAGENTGVIA